MTGATARSARGAGGGGPPPLLAAPDGYHVIDDMVAEGDKVVTRLTARGTQTGELFGIPPTGKRFTMTGIAVHRVRDGKIVEHWHEIDMLAGLQQLGVVPAPGQSGNRRRQAMGGQSYVVAGGELITWQVRGRPGDAYSLFENVTQPGYPGPPPHRHLTQDESWYVLDGTFAFDVDGQTTAAVPGDCVHAPRGSLHTFRNTGTTVGRLLVAVGPAGDFEAFVEETGEPTTASVPPVLAGPPPPEVIARVLAGARRHHIEIPPPRDAAH